MLSFRLPLFWKFSIAIVLIVFMFGSINTYITWKNVKQGLEKETEKRGLYIADNLADQAVEFLLYEDYFELQNLVNSSQAADSTIAYIFILDKKQETIIHTFEQNVPLELIEINQLEEGQEVQMQKIYPKDYPRDIILDIAVPIFGGRLGTVRVGIHEKYIMRDVRHTVSFFMILAIIFLVTGIFGAFVFSYIITKPIQVIQDIASRIDLDDLKNISLQKIIIRKKFLGRWRMLFRAEDEIDLLVSKFNDMIIRLENTYSELVALQWKLIQSEKMATIGIIASGLAHEINNPLAGIQSCLSWISKNSNMKSQNNKYIDLIMEATRRIERVIQRMLDFSRKQDFTFQKISFKEVLENALMLVGYRLEKSHISVYKKISKDLPPLWGSALHLEQMFVNMIMNSIDSIEECCLKNDKCKRQISFSVSRLDGFINIRIKDTGIGIRKNILNKIFDPFFTTKRIGKGTGLGLAVTYNIVQAHSGRISVQSKYNNGAVFEIRLPVGEKVI